MLLKPVFKLLNALNTNVKKSQLAAGFAWGVVLGLIPIGNIFWILIFLMTFFFRHNHGTKLLAMTITIILSPIFVYTIDWFGWEILNYEALRPTFTSLYNMPFVPFTNFNNTLVMGGLVGGLILWIPVFLIIMAIITIYRKVLGPKIRSIKVFQFIANFSLFRLFNRTLTK